MESKEQSIDKTTLKATRKHVPFIRLSEAGTIERKIKISGTSKEKPENIEKIQFKCQPKSRDSSHTSLDGITKNTPVKEIIYRLIVNNRSKMKLGEIVENTLAILKGRKLSGYRENQDVHLYFYGILKEDTEYGFEEIE